MGEGAEEESICYLSGKGNKGGRRQEGLFCAAAAASRSANEGGSAYNSAGRISSTLLLFALPPLLLRGLIRVWVSAALVPPCDFGSSKPQKVASSQIFLDKKVRTM